MQLSLEAKPSAIIAVIARGEAECNNWCYVMTRCCISVLWHVKNRRIFYYFIRVSNHDLSQSRMIRIIFGKVNGQKSNSVLYTVTIQRIN